MTECPSPLQALAQHVRARRGPGAKCPVCNRQLHLPAKPEDLPVNVTVQRAMARMLGHEIQVRGRGLY
jgi:DNA repair exonuclease SbcCD ATPase subunit